MDYYAILGVEKTATADEIKKAYRKLAMKCHPDRNEGDADKEKKFKDATNAYDVLSDPNKRKAYDNGHRNFNGREGNFQDFHDIFKQAFGNFVNFGQEDFFHFQQGSNYGYGGHGHTRTHRRVFVIYGEDVHLNLKISLEESQEGAKKKIKFKKKMVCVDCGGTGVVSEDESKTCPACGGKRFKEEDHIQQVDLPGGIMHGQVISLREGGHEGINAPNGELIVTILFKEHPIFKLDQNNLIMNLWVSPHQFNEGFDIIYKCPRSKATRKLTHLGEETKTPAKIMIKGYGLITYDKRLGDLHVNINVDFEKDNKETEIKIDENCIYI